MVPRFGFLLALFMTMVATLAVAQSIPVVEGGPTYAAHLAFTSPDGRLAWLPAGDDRVQLLGDAGVQYAFPAWSPDGTRIAAIARSAAGAHAVVFDVTADPPTLETWWEVPRRNVIYLDWAHAGDALHLLVSDQATGFTFRRATQDDATIIERGSPLFWDERADGTLIVHSGGLGRARLTLRDGEGTELADLGTPGAFRSPAASSTGDWWAFGALEAGGVFRLVVEQSEQAQPASSLTGPERRALQHAGLTAFAWHPTRDLLALNRPVVQAPHSFGPLGGLDAETGLYETWTEETVVAFWWSPDGSRIGMLASAGSGNGQVASLMQRPTLASTTPLAVMPDAVDAAPGPTQPERTQGALTLRFGTVEPNDGTVTWVGTVRPGTVFSREYLPYFDQYARSHEIWSPDGASLALNVLDEEGRDVIGILDVDAGTIRHLAPGTMPAWSPTAN